jgi:hypothetical protein
MSILATVLGVFVIAVLTCVYLVIKVRRNLPQMMEAQKQFFTLTGYRHPEIPNAPIDEQVRFYPRRVSMADALTKGRLETRYVKPDPTGALEYSRESFSERSAAGIAKIHRESWRLALGTPPKLGLQIAEKKIVKQRNIERRGNTRTWTLLYETPIELDDAVMSDRFAVYGTDAIAIRRVLARPDIRERLLACAEVDLLVDGRSIVFSDPSGKNIKAGRMGNSSILESIPVHQRVQAMLGALRDEVS